MGEAQRRTDARLAIPRTESEIDTAAKALGLHIPEACMPGVVANLALLHSHADTLLGQDPAP